MNKSRAAKTEIKRDRNSVERGREGPKDEEEKERAVFVVNALGIHCAALGNQEKWSDFLLGALRGGRERGN